MFKNRALIEVNASSFARPSVRCIGVYRPIARLDPCTIMSFAPLNRVLPWRAQFQSLDTTGLSETRLQTANAKLAGARKLALFCASEDGPRAICKRKAAAIRLVRLAAAFGISNFRLMATMRSRSKKGEVGLCCAQPCDRPRPIVIMVLPTVFNRSLICSL
jgi:hypothetical protein